MARIPYLNTAPYYLNWHTLEAASEGRWIPEVLPPRQLGWAAEAGEVDAGVLAVADLLRLEESFEPLPVPGTSQPRFLGIANHTWVDSVLLFIRQSTGRSPAEQAAPGRSLSPAEARTLDGARLGITGESSTSYRLLRLLLEVRWNVRPAAYMRRVAAHTAAQPAVGERLEESASWDAILVIGDEALRWKHRPPSGYRLGMDLAAAWHAWTGLPFVFACWGVRRSVPEDRKAWLGRFLDDSLAQSEQQWDRLVTGVPADLGSPGELVEYLRNFTYRLGPVELESIAYFRSLLQMHGIDCTRE